MWGGRAPRCDCLNGLAAELTVRPSALRQDDVSVGRESESGVHRAAIIRRQ